MKDRIFNPGELIKFRCSSKDEWRNGIVREVSKGIISVSEPGHLWVNVFNQESMIRHKCKF